MVVRSDKKDVKCVKPSGEWCGVRQVVDETKTNVKKMVKGKRRRSRSTKFKSREESTPILDPPLQCAKRQRLPALIAGIHLAKRSTNASTYIPWLHLVRRI